MLAGLTLVGLVPTAILTAVNSSIDEDPLFIPVAMMMIAGYSVTGAVLASRQPRNPIGWLLLAVGGLFLLTGLSDELMQWLYRDGDTSRAVDGFLRHVCGDEYRAVLERKLPGAYAEALEEADLFFQAELPAVQQWSFGADDADPSAYFFRAGDAQVGREPLTGGAGGRLRRVFSPEHGVARHMAH